MEEMYLDLPGYASKEQADADARLEAYLTAVGWEFTDLLDEEDYDG